MVKHARSRDAADTRHNLSGSTQLAPQGHAERSADADVVQWDVSAVFDLQSEVWLRDPAHAPCVDSRLPAKFKELVGGKIHAAKRGRIVGGAAGRKKSAAGYLCLLGAVDAPETAVPRLLADWSRHVHRFLTEGEGDLSASESGRSHLLLRHLTEAPSLVQDAAVAADTPQARPDSADATAEAERQQRLIELISEIRQLRAAERHDVIPTLRLLRKLVRSVRELVGQEVEQVFNRFEGHEFPPRTNDRVATLMDEIATSLQLCFECVTADGAKVKTKLRSGSSGRPGDIRFQYQAYHDGKSAMRRSSKSLLHATLVPARRDRRRRTDA